MRPWAGQKSWKRRAAVPGIRPLELTGMTDSLCFDKGSWVVFTELASVSADEWSPEYGNLGRNSSRIKDLFSSPIFHLLRGLVV